MQSSAPFLSPPPSPAPAPQPLLTSSVAPCSELNLSITLSPAPKVQHTLKPRPPRSLQRHDQSQPRPRPQGRMGRPGSTKVCFKEPDGVMVTAEPHQPIRNQGGPHASEHWSGSSAGTSNPHPELLERPQLNTTLTVRTQLQSVQGSEFNTDRAVKQVLQRSDRTKNQINARATEEVNIARSRLLFSSLVSVDVREDQLLRQVMQDRLLPPRPCSRAQDGPSLFPLMTSDLLRQRPLPLLREETGAEFHPLTRPACFTFDLYRRRLRCETTW